MKPRTIAVSMATLAVAALAVSPVVAQAVSTPEAPEGATFAFINALGTGCPAGTSTGTVSPDGKSVTVAMSQQNATAGPNVSIVEARKGCQASLQVKAPAGWSYAVAAIDSSTTAKLPGGATALLTTSVYHQGEEQTSSAKTYYTGATDQAYPVRQAYAEADLAWSSCDPSNRFLNVKSTVQITSPNAVRESAQSLKAESFRLSMADIVWKKCPADPAPTTSAPTTTAPAPTSSAPTAPAPSVTTVPVPTTTSAPAPTTTSAPVPTSSSAPAPSTTSPKPTRPTTTMPDRPTV